MSRAAAFRPEVRVLPDSGAAARFAAELLTAACCEAAARRGRCTLLLSGGKTPLELFRLLRAAPPQQGLPWENTHVFWADERCVPPDHPRSNYGAALDVLLRHVPAAGILRMRGEDDPEAAAPAYERILRTQLREVDGMPAADCILLGMGEDGHVASLFPGTSALAEQRRIVLAVRPEELEPRLTVTLPVLNNAACCIVLVTGERKRRALNRALDPGADVLPVHLVRPCRGRLWFVADRAAAAEV